MSCEFLVSLASFILAEAERVVPICRCRFLATGGVSRSREDT